MGDLPEAWLIVDLSGLPLRSMNDIRWMIECLGNRALVEEMGDNAAFTLNR